MIALWLALAGPAFGQDAIPQDYPIDVERFRPMADTYGYALTESASTLYNLQVGVAMWGNYSEDAAVLNFNGDRVHRVPTDRRRALCPPPSGRSACCRSVAASAAS